MENNNRGINDNEKNNTLSDGLNSSKGVSFYQNSAFQNNVFYTLAKRSERITTAVYMVSNFVAKDNNLREEMRRYGLRVIKNLYRCVTCDAYDQQFFLEEALASIEYLVTVMSIAQATGSISQMNKEVLEKALHDLGIEIHKQLQVALRYEQNFSQDVTHSIDKDTLLEFLQENVDAGDSVSSESFQQVLQEAMIHKTTFKTTQNDVLSKRQNKRHSVQKTSQSGSAGERRKRIQEIIADKGETTIKDIATRITNCSEKTLQRDLVKMIKDNIIEKEGDKRWSVYRIKDINKNDTD